MRNITVGRTVAAPLWSVWSVLADYPNISEWNGGVRKSFAIGDATDGIGAQRRCELAPNGKMSMRETVTQWHPEERLTVDIDEIEKMPIRGATMTFALSPDGNATAVEMRYDYRPKGGLLAAVFGPILDRQMKKGFQGFIDYLEPAAQSRAAG